MISTKNKHQNIVIIYLSYYLLNENIKYSVKILVKFTFKTTERNTVVSGNPITSIKLESKSYEMVIQFKEPIDEILCIPCIKGKQHRLPFRQSSKRSTECLMLIHLDVCVAGWRCRLLEYRDILQYLLMTLPEKPLSTS